LSGDGTTATHAVFVDTTPTSSWYLVVSSTTTVSSRVVHVLDDSEVVIGRVATCDVAIDHEAVSRRHAMFRRRGDQIAVEDLGSRNGTLVNGVLIDQPRRLTAGDVVTIGPLTAVVATSSAARNSRQIATISELDDRLDSEVDRAHRYHRPLALLMARFYGPTDAVTIHVERLGSHLRRMDLLAEYGVDEIALVLPEADRAAAEVVAARVGQAGDLRVHVGVALFPADGSSAGELVSAARERLRGARASRPALAAEPPTTSVETALGRNVVIADAQMTQVFELAKRVAMSNITVLVNGETGSGKEVVAEDVHRFSPRAGGAFVRLNCAALSESLVEAELFGYEKGAFTGAIGTKKGFFEVASGGTLFLDEIGELPASTQAKLLRVLEMRKIVRVGGTAEIAVDVRLICATNRELDVEVRRGRFREDLYFRISAFVIPLPPLRDRRGEIPLLAAQFARELSAELGLTTGSVSDEALAILGSYDWPGNVRELRNVIERAIVMSPHGKIEPDHLPERVRERASRGGLSGAASGPLDVRQRVAVVERDAVVQALEANRGNQTQAARQLGISRFALIRLMEKHELKPRPGR
jgi:DNA-binding NtrC family response regulator/pSer/pThr/pTyr-binding forkhead associated (FHA) protein